MAAESNNNFATDLAATDRESARVKPDSLPMSYPFSCEVTELRHSGDKNLFPFMNAVLPRCLASASITERSVDIAR